MNAVVNTEVNGWCPLCAEWSVRGRHDQCMWCDTDLLDSAYNRHAIPLRVVRDLVRYTLDRLAEEAREEQEASERALRERREAIEAKRLATMRANGTRRGTGLLRITEDVLREAHELYWTGHNDEGRPLSVRQVAAIILPRTGYKSAKTCANCLHDGWKARGWPARDRIEATRAASIVHGELVGTKGEKTPEAKARKLAYKAKRRRRRRCAGTTTKGAPCSHWAQNGKDVCEVHDPDRREEVVTKLAEVRARRGRQKQATTTKGAANVSRDHRTGHDDERPREAVAWPRSGARNEAA